MPEKRWFILAFRPRYDVLEDIVGGDQVRPFELFNAYAAAGHRVHIWETDGVSVGERSFHNGSLVVRPLRYSFGILRFSIHCAGIFDTCKKFVSWYKNILKAGYNT